MTESELNLGNPMHMSEEERREYMERHDKARYFDYPQNNATNRYKGSQALKSLIEQQCVSVGTILRVSDYGRTMDPGFILTRQGLVDREDPEGTPQPLEILDKYPYDPNQYHWNLEGYDPIWEGNRYGQD